MHDLTLVHVHIDRDSQCTLLLLGRITHGPRPDPRSRQILQSSQELNIL